MSTALPLWLEGMLIKPQHFQQLSRYHTRQTHSQLEPYHWGVEQLNVNEAALREGQLVIERISGWLKDGSYFDTQDNAALPKPFVLNETAKQSFYLSKTETHKADRRWIKNDLDPLDEHEVSLGLIELHLSNKRLPGSFKLMEITNERGFFINTQYCPPSTILTKEIVGLTLKTPPKPQNTPNGLKQIQQQLALTLFYACKAQLELLLEHKIAHPFEHYRLLRSFALTLSEFSSCGIKKIPYDHEAIAESLKTYVQAINHSMNSLMRDEKSWLFQRQNTQYFDLTLSDYDEEAVFYLRINEEEKHSALKHAKLAETRQLKDCVHYGLPGIELVPSTQPGTYQFQLNKEERPAALSLYFPEKTPEHWSISVWQS